MATMSMNPKSVVEPGNEVIHAEVFIAAPRERVFQALTDPRQAAQWWGQKDRYHCANFQMDLRPGGKWSTKGNSAKMGDFTASGNYIEVDPPSKLSYTWNTSWMPRDTTVAWELHPQNGGTLVKLSHSGFAGDEEQAKNHNSGWEMVLGWLRGYAEKGETVESRS